ncbi:MAG: hypothetical protein N2422_08455 [Rhodobacteraceae bacterium]|nr:hypothetical protein [Paracoccaceae bacterium]
MARRRRTEPAPPRLPPPTRGAAWAAFAGWVLGVPAVVAATLAIIWAGLWAAGSAGPMLRTELQTGGILWYLGIILLLYPAMLWVWTTELREALAARREWEALGEGTGGPRLAGQAAAEPPPARRRRRAGA